MDLVFTVGKKVNLNERKQYFYYEIYLGTETITKLYSSIQSKNQILHEVYKPVLGRSVFLRNFRDPMLTE